MLCKHTPSNLNVLRHDARSLARGFAMAGTSAAACGVVWGLVCVREGTRAVDPAWYTRQTPISEDKGPGQEKRRAAAVSSLRKLSSGGCRYHDRHPSKRHVGACLGSRPPVSREPDGSGGVGGTTRVGTGDASHSAFMASLTLHGCRTESLGPFGYQAGLV